MIYQLLILFVIFLWFLNWRNTRIFVSISQIPGPTPLPFLGSLLELGFDTVALLKNFMRISNTYGPLTKLQLGPKQYYVLVTDPGFTELILSSPKYITKAIEYDIMKSWLGNGLLLSTGSYWQKRRKIITPAFHFKILDQFIGIFTEESKNLVRRLSENVGKSSCDICPYVTACTLDIICETAMGVSSKAQDKFVTKYIKAVKELLDICIKKTVSPWKQFDLLFQCTSDFRKSKELLKIVHGFSKAVIEQRRQKLIDNNINGNVDSTDDDGIKKKMVFLDVLLQATVDGHPLSDEDIREEVDTFMFAGHDTNASLIEFTMYELAKNPEVQEKVFTEIREIFGNDKSYQPNLQDLNEMKYTELVLKETLRLYPSVPMIARKLEEDINYKGIILPKDLTLVLFIHSMQRRPDLFPEPTKFNPERFLEKNNERHPFSYVPFSAGPRNCIGQKFAMLEAKSIISQVIMNYELLPADSKYDVILAYEVILKSSNGVHVQLKNRQF